MPFELTILGTSSATPTIDRHPSAQFLAFGEHFILIDCGEAAQVQLMRFGLKSFKISKIFISHLHPDHYLGLPGLLSSLSLKGRTEPMDIYSPKGIQEILEVQFLYGDMHLSYEIRYHILEVGSEKPIFEDSSLCVHSFPVEHRLPCWGFLFKEKKFSRKINKELPTAQKLPVDAYTVLRQGKDFTCEDGTVLRWADHTIPAEPPVSYVYITDTLYLPDLARSLARHDISILYHEATFMNDLKEKAINTRHSTAKEAAEFALLSKTKKLVIGHFSSRYGEPVVLLNEAKAIFPETYLALEGEKFCS